MATATLPNTFETTSNANTVHDPLPIIETTFYLLQYLFHEALNFVNADVEERCWPILLVKEIHEYLFYFKYFLIYIYIYIYYIVNFIIFIFFYYCSLLLGVQ